MLYAVLSGFVYALLIPVFIKLSKRFIGWTAAVLPLGVFIYFSTFYNIITNGEVISQTYSWIPSLGIELSFYLDGLSLTFALIISLVGFVVFLYAGSYMEGHKYIARFYVYISIFMASMIGLVTSDNLITMFVFWELTSITLIYLSDLITIKNVQGLSHFRHCSLPGAGDWRFWLV